MFPKRILILPGISLVIGSFEASAQQPLPRPIVLYRSVQNTTQYPQPSQSAQPTPPRSATMAPPAFDRQWAGSGTQPRGPVTITTNPALFPNASPNPVGTNSAIGALNGSANQATQQVSQNGSLQNGQANEADTKGQTPEQQWAAEQQSRPTLQAMQNPSGAANLSHNGFTNAQQMAPNTYLGPQFQTWTNQQAVNQMPSSYGELSRMQPGPFGGYVAPNTYMGTGYSSWNNLTQGGISAGATGSWDFSIWP